MYEFIHSHSKQWTIEMMCQVLKVPRRSYYYWIRSRESKRIYRRRLLESRIQEVYVESKGRYGSPRISRELTYRGYTVSSKTVSKYMRKMGLRSKLSRKYRVTTCSSHTYPIVPNLLARNFTTEKQGQVWVSDITYIRTREGFLYLTSILDLFDRKVIGWSISEGMKSEETVIQAFKMAITRRTPQKNLIFHSDRGIQYASHITANYLSSYRVCRSMSRKANCWDNAVAESFFKSLKSEMIYGYKLVSKLEMKTQLFEYLEIWYNRKRRHSFLNYLTIKEFNDLQQEKKIEKNLLKTPYLCVQV